MYQTIGLSQFRDGFKYLPDNFSYEGLGALFDYFETMDEDFEFDPIAICCNFSEDTVEGIAQSYDIEGEDLRIAVIRKLEDKGAYVHETEDGKIVYRNF